MESGHYSLAGFVYQMLGTALEALDICRHNEEPLPNSNLLTLEFFGQDAYISHTEASGKPKLVQYKYSSVGADIERSEFREILWSFLCSVELIGKNVAEVEFELTTNRDRASSTLEILNSKGSPSKAEELLLKKLDFEAKGKKTRKRNKEYQSNKAELAMIARNLKWTALQVEECETDILKLASNLGVLSHERDERIESLLGYFFEVASTPNFRSIYRSRLNKTLAGHDHPYLLKSSESRKLQIASVKSFRNSEVGAQYTVSRKVVKDIIESARTNPLTVITGNGGMGKSIACIESVAACISNSSDPPDFSLVKHSLSLNKQDLIDDMAAWRNRPPSKDGANLSEALLRLAGASKLRPYLSIYVDGIDEKQGLLHLGGGAHHFLVELINRAFDSTDDSGRPTFSLILSCRSEQEIEHLLPRVHNYHIKFIPVADFDDDEIRELSEQIDQSVAIAVNACLENQSITGEVLTSAKLDVEKAEALQIIRQPINWGVFSSLNPEEQLSCLRGDSQGLHALAEGFLNWFETKASLRIVKLESGIPTAVLCEAAKLFQDTANVTASGAEWKRICEASDCGTVYQRHLFREAVSSGILTEEETKGHKWRWQQEWLCRCLNQELDIQI